MNFKEGQTVEHKIYGYIGNIVKIYSNFQEVMNDPNQFISMSGEDWFDAQEPSYDYSERFDPWYKILCIDGGSILTSSSRLKIPKNLLN